MNRVVLVVDDQQRCIDHHLKVLDGLGLTVVTALTLPDANKLYDEHREELAAIILDGCVPGDSVNTFPFIAKVSADKERWRYTGILVAASSMRGYRRQMVLAGCTHEAPKDDAAGYVLELLTSQ